MVHQRISRPRPRRRRRRTTGRRRTRRPAQAAIIGPPSPRPHSSAAALNSSSSNSEPSAPGGGPCWVTRPSSLNTGSAMSMPCSRMHSANSSISACISASCSGSISRSPRAFSMSGSQAVWASWNFSSSISPSTAMATPPPSPLICGSGMSMPWSRMHSVNASMASSMSSGRRGALRRRVRCVGRPVVEAGDVVVVRRRRRRSIRTPRRPSRAATASVGEAQPSEGVLAAVMAAHGRRTGAERSDERR